MGPRLFSLPKPDDDGGGGGSDDEPVADEKCFAFSMMAWVLGIEFTSDVNWLSNRLILSSSVPKRSESVPCVPIMNGDFNIKLN